MGFRNPFRIQVDENDVAYVTDYSPDSQQPQQFRGPAGHGPRTRSSGKPANYGWPLCYSPNLPYYRWNFNTRRRWTATPQPYECATRTRGPEPTRAGTSSGGPAVEPGRAQRAAAHQAGHLVLVPRQQRGHPARHAVLRLLRPNALTDPPAPGSKPCPQLFPELYTGGVGPHGAAKYHYDPANPNPTKFPPYYDDAVILGEFTQDTLREVKLDSQNRVFKINRFLDCGAATSTTRRSRSSATTRWTCSGAPTASSTC